MQEANDMEFPRWLVDIFNAGALREENTRLKEELESSEQLCNQTWEQKKVALDQLFILQNQYKTMASQMNSTIEALDTCRKLTKADKALISTLTSTIDSLNKEMNQSRETLYLKPLPALLREVPKNDVMLSDYIIMTAQGKTYPSYPDHPSVFQPCPMFEKVLTSAGCNTRRDDISPVQIAKLISNVLQLKMSYVSDQSLWGRIDNWTLPTTALSLRKDDCESLSCVILSALFYYQLKFGAFKDYSCFMGLGHLVLGGKRYGHGFVMLIHDTSTDLKDSFIIEATDRWASSPMSLHSIKDKYDCDWGLIGYVRNSYKEGTYEIKTPWW
jgi:hypothetical protein